MADMQLTMVNTFCDPAIGCIRIPGGADKVAGRLRTCVVYRQSGLPRHGGL